MADASRGVMLLAIIACMLVAGCATTPTGSLTSAHAPQGTTANNTTLAPAGRGGIEAFKETNQTEKTGAGSMAHRHDYWGADTRKVIWRQDLAFYPPPLLPNGKPAGSAVEEDDIPAPGLVYEGTAHLDLLVTNLREFQTNQTTVDQAEPAHPHVSLFFDYLTAADEPDAYHAGGQLQPGVPFSIPVAPNQADMPHSQHSLWLFRFYTGEPNSVFFNITATVVRGTDVVDWPPHPDLYAGKSTRTLYDAQASIQSKGTAQGLIDGTDANWVTPERVISFGTDWIDINITNVQYSPTIPVPPDHYVLEYHNASFVPKLGNGDQAGARLVDPSTDGKTWHFHIPTDPMGYDSPYGSKSRWEFRFEPRYADPTDCGQAARPAIGDDGYGQLQELLVGCQYVPYTLTYHMTIVAHGHSTADGVG